MNTSEFVDNPRARAIYNAAHCVQPLRLAEVLFQRHSVGIEVGRLGRREEVREV